MIYGNLVAYITCKLSELDEIPIIDGQLISFYDADGLYYDMGDVRHKLNSSLSTNQLVSPGVVGNIYIVYNSKDPNIKDGIYLWDAESKQYVSIIPDPVIQEDAHDNKWYQRMNGKWVTDSYVYHIDEDEGMNNIESKLKSYIETIDAYHTLEIVGDIVYRDDPLSLSGDCAIDFSKCNFKNYDSSDKKYRTGEDWYDIKLSGFTKISNLKTEGVFIELTGNGSRTIENCYLVDSRILLSDEADCNITDCVFEVSKSDYIPVVCKQAETHNYKSGAILISSSTFRLDAPEGKDIESACPGVAIVMRGNVNGGSSISSNYFYNMICMQYPEGNSGDSNSYSLLQYKPSTEFLKNNYRVFPVRELNTVLLDPNVLGTRFIEYLSHKREIGNLFLLGEVMSICDEFSLGIAEIGNDGKDVILEINPETVTNMKKLVEISEKIISEDISFVSLRLCSVFQEIPLDTLSNTSLKNLLEIMTREVCQGDATLLSVLTENEGYTHNYNALPTTSSFNQTDHIYAADTIGKKLPELDESFLQIIYNSSLSDSISVETQLPREDSDYRCLVIITTK